MPATWKIAVCLFTSNRVEEPVAFLDVEVTEKQLTGAMTDEDFARIFLQPLVFQLRQAARAEHASQVN